ncbi:MAG: AAA family ATPase [Alphaproteobacteria bacterium]|nr:AAA family ATPase [Alphaproteobacteria bacterium]
MHFSKLRLSGFKSFVDPVELAIDSGITGVVGPNGCGKSNVIEALRWVMGETSAKRMRGSEMDDVIFGGSSGRPARNVAEVTLLLDNADGAAPSPYNTGGEVEITRRIERGAGSHYRINGNEARARDVQLLFADLATGSNSTAIVSQGRIGAIIGAKPTERRLLLEEAAGIRGLHSRRHEAELRLRAAETNLERLEDVIGALESQQQGLQRQARQANRFRRLSDHLRRHEAVLLHLRWQAAEADLEAARAALKVAEAVVQERAGESAGAAKRQADAAAALPPIREDDAAAAAELQRLQLAVREIESEEERILAARDALAQRMIQIAGDLEREKALFDDARTALERLAAERAEIESAQAEESEKRAAADEEAREAAAAVEEQEDALAQLTEEVAGVEAQRAALQRSIGDRRQRLDALARRRAGLDQQETSLRAEQKTLGEIEAAEAAVSVAEEQATAARTAAEDAEAAMSLLRQAESAAREALQQSEAAAREALEQARERGRSAIASAEAAGRESVEALESRHRALEAEINALAAVLEQHDAALTADIRPLIDSLTVRPGFETALGAAFGEELDASTDAAAPVHWTALPPISGAMGLPGGVDSLAKYVDGPAALSRRLSQIGVAPDAATGARLQSQLGPGQRLVSIDGDLWRWDGYTVAAGAPTAAAKRLEQKNRLAEVREEIAALTPRLEKARESAERNLAEARDQAATDEAEAAAQTEAATETARALLDTATSEAQAGADREQTAKTRLQEAFSALNKAQQRLSSLAGKAADLRSRLEGIDSNRQQLDVEIKESEAAIAGAEQAIGVLEDPVQARERVNRLRSTVAELRSTLIDKRGASERFRREAETRAERLEQIDADRRSWAQRVEGAEARQSDLTQRAGQAEEERAALEERPRELQEQRNRLSDSLVAAQAKRQTVADALALAEQEQAEADKGLRSAEAALAESRETRVRREAEVEQRGQASETVRDRIAERLDCPPEGALAAGGVGEDEELGAREEVERKFERLTRERDNMGPVNLRAEQEAAELDEQIASMHTERDDLIAAIGRLRQGINALNREGRERLLAAFEQVNGHFQDLFKRLFGGGEARLTLTEAEDPLQSGLEIMASPPGKRMQIMSLLSGGEQALTALALLFGVFLTNPAPICVLDEVDAPLDDTNVDRFCTLLDEIAHTGQTRFLVVTHHRLTMARVDRLFGVTMAERGVSQLVSVDLREASRIRESA